ncbi:MAG: single-stranded-DNA-specific exonuclease RecJ [Anaerolineales bacterium]|jgi:single-stranded-DNA-specific exonuclease
MLKKWINAPLVSPPKSLQDEVGGHPLVLETLIRRGFTTPSAIKAFLNPDCYTPTLAKELPGIQKAAKRILQSKYDEKTICVWGDFDVDGQTATTLLVSALKTVGARVIFHIPVRSKESHGINQKVLKNILGQGMDLLVTCDTGISAHEPIVYAQSRGVDVIVTDHHELPHHLPDAHMIVNPKMLARDHPLVNLPGVGVAYKLIEELSIHAKDLSNCEQYLDLVALGIVADIATQTDDTRYLLQKGLQSLRNTNRLGLKIMLEVANLKPDEITEEHIAFVIAPRLNALGRLSDANDVVEFLTTKDSGRARILATNLEGLNAKRKLLTDQVFQATLERIRQEHSILNEPALVLDHPKWPPGVIGIVASRLVERFNKPTILIASKPNQPAQGSARSVNGLDITAAISRQDNMLIDFGGHQMAAGLKINPERIVEFRRSFFRTVEEMLKHTPMESVLQLDGHIPLSDLTYDLVKDIERLAPFGAGNPPLVLESPNHSIKDYTSIGKQKEHLKLKLDDKGGNIYEVIWWQGAGWTLPKGRFNLAYKVRTRDYRGTKGLQIEWVDAQIDQAVVIPNDRQQITYEIVDYRNIPDPLPIISRLQNTSEIQVWVEADRSRDVPGKDRFNISKGETLAIWTVPPSNGVLKSVLSQVKPKKVILFAANPNLDRFDRFMKTLIGLIKYTISNKNGETELNSLVTALAHRINTVQLGLAWLEAFGHIRFTINGDTVIFDEGDQIRKSEGEEIETVLRMALEETAAYRAHFTQADEDYLINQPINDKIYQPD